MPHPLLDSETINQAEALGLSARQVVEGYMSGEHPSPFRGFSIEFTQHREYVSGDDLRHLDWKVLGRTDRYYLKQYEQETNFVAHLLLDASESMRYSSQRSKAAASQSSRFSKTPRATLSKLEYAKRMAACLSYLILYQRDAVAVGIFDQAIKEQIPRTGNLSSIHDIMLMLARFNPTGQTAIGQVLHDLAGQIRRKGIVILISDLFDDEQKILDGIQHLRFGGNEVIVFHTMDPYELEFPFEGLVEFEGLEQIPKVLARPNEVRKTYMREVEAFQRRLREGCERQNTHYVPINTAHPLHEVIAGYLAFRQRTK
jgi:uncharacterized protein (DUF58 family)